MKLFSPSSPRHSLHLLYSLIVIILVPSLLALNTFYLLRVFRRDTDFELNNKALLTASAVALHARSLLTSPSSLSTDLADLTARLPEIVAVDILTASGSSFASVASTSPLSTRFTDSVLNQLAWANQSAYSKQIIASFPPHPQSRVWLVATPIADNQGRPLGLVNLFLSAQTSDEITARSVRDSLIILTATIIFVILLLINHFRLFQISLWFKRLKEVDELKDNFISVASHELRAPITAIIGYTSLLLKHPTVAATPDIKSDLGSILHATDRLKNLISDMLDVSRIEQNRLTFTLAPHNLADLISQTITDLQPQADAKHLTLSYEPPPAPLIISIDPDKMRQVLNNLIGNAVKYTLQGSVTVSHSVSAKSATILITDTGIGMTPVDRSRLFSKFYRIQSDATADIPGTGLGLWITKQLVEKMGGSIAVDSIVNRGSQFTLTFPLPKP